MSKTFYGNLRSFRDIINLREPLPTRPVMDVTAKFAQDMINLLRSWCLKDSVNGTEARRLWKHIDRYQDICDRHTTYEPDGYGYGDIRYSYK